jgi:hypothetical protein
VLSNLQRIQISKVDLTSIVHLEVIVKAWRQSTQQCLTRIELNERLCEVALVWSTLMSQEMLKALETLLSLKVFKCTQLNLDWSITTNPMILLAMRM